MQELEVTFKHATQIWWAWVWRTMLFSLLAGLVAGVVVGFTAGVLGFHPKQIGAVSMGLGFVIGIYIAIHMMVKVLNKKFSTFRIALIKTDLM